MIKDVRFLFLFVLYEWLKTANLIRISGSNRLFLTESLTNIRVRNTWNWRQNLTCVLSHTSCSELPILPVLLALSLFFLALWFVGLRLLLDLSHGCLVFFVGFWSLFRATFFDRDDSSFWPLKALRSAVCLLIWIVFLVQIFIGLSVGKSLVLLQSNCMTFSGCRLFILLKDRHKCGHEPCFFFHLFNGAIILDSLFGGITICKRCVPRMREVRGIIPAIHSIKGSFGCCRKLFIWDIHNQILHVNLIDVGSILLFFLCVDLLSFFCHVSAFSQKMRFWLLCLSCFAL